MRQAGRWHRGFAITPTGNDDGACLRQQLQAAVGQDVNAAHGAHRPCVDGDDAVLVPREIELRPGEAEDFHGNPELEGTEAVVGQNRDQSR
jgi:hypothetical protein